MGVVDVSVVIGCDRGVIDVVVDCVFCHVVGGFEGEFFVEFVVLEVFFFGGVLGVFIDVGGRDQCVVRIARHWGCFIDVLFIFVNVVVGIVGYCARWWVGFC